MKFLKKCVNAVVLLCMIFSYLSFISKALASGDIVVTVDHLTTSDRSPELTGTVSDVNAQVAIWIDGFPQVAETFSDGTWKLPKYSFYLSNGTYDVNAEAHNFSTGKHGTDDTDKELIIFDDHSPSPILDSLPDISLLNQNSYVLRGSAEENSLVKISFFDGLNQIDVPKIIVDNFGRFNTDSINLSSLDDGDITLILSAEDDLGNFSDDLVLTLKKNSIELNPVKLISSSGLFINTTEYDVSADSNDSIGNTLPVVGMKVYEILLLSFISSSLIGASIKKLCKMAIK